MKVRDVHASCGNKEGFASRVDCQKRAANRNSKGKRVMHVYKCSNCGLFHFGCESKGNKMLNRHEPKTRTFIDRDLIEDRLKDGNCLIRL